MVKVMFFTLSIMKKKSFSVENPQKKKKIRETNSQWLKEIWE